MVHTLIYALREGACLTHRGISPRGIPERDRDYITLRSSGCSPSVGRVPEWDRVVHSELSASAFGRVHAPLMGIQGPRVLPLEYRAGPVGSRLLPRAMYVAPSTIRTHVKSIYRKFGVSSRKDAVLEARLKRLV